MSFQVTNPSALESYRPAPVIAIAVAAGRRMLSLRVDVGRVGVADAVRAAVVVADAEEEQQRGQKVQVVGAAMAATHRVTQERTKTKRDTQTTIGNEDTTRRWEEQEGQVVDRNQCHFFVVAWRRL